MKKLLTGLLAVCVLTGCSSGSKDETITITNPITLNTSKADMSGYQWLDDSDPAFAEITLKESIRMFSEKGSGILFYGMPDCAWCQRAVPELNAAAKACGITVYYVNAEETVTKEDYDTLVSYIESIFETDDDGTKSFQVPEVIAVKNGSIVGHHLSLVDGFTLDNDDTQMSDSQKKELQKIYKEVFALAKD